MKFKIVDAFNGHENPERYETLEDAETALERDRRAFKANPLLTNCKYCGEIVQANAVWTWDERYSMYLWTVPN